MAGSANEVHYGAPACARTATLPLSKCMLTEGGNCQGLLLGRDTAARAKISVSVPARDDGRGSIRSITICPGPRQLGDAAVTGRWHHAPYRLRPVVRSFEVPRGVPEKWICCRSIWRRRASHPIFLHK